MNVTFQCQSCTQAVRVDVPEDAAEVQCPRCGLRMGVPQDAVLADGKLERCLVCPSTELFVRKDFPQRLGVAIVTVGFAASCVSWYFEEVVLTFAILFGTALIDVVLYVLVGESIVCYRCHAEYRLVTGSERHGAFDLQTHERYRQQAARLAQHAGKGSGA